MMKRATLSLITLLSLFVINGCSSSTETKANGSITVQLTGAAEANGKNVFFSVVPPDANMENPDMEDIKGANYFTIENWTGEAIAIDLNTFQTKIFKGGQKFGIVIFVDINESIDLSDFEPVGFQPLPGDRFTREAIMVTVDGNKKVVVNYEDLFELPLQSWDE
jgi:hypothetical protein